MQIGKKKPNKSISNFPRYDRRTFNFTCKEIQITPANAAEKNINLRLIEFFIIIIIIGQMN